MFPTNKQTLTKKVTAQKAKGHKMPDNLLDIEFCGVYPANLAGKKMNYLAASFGKLNPKRLNKYGRCFI